MKIYMNGEQFNQIMNMAKNVASFDETRPTLTGIHLVCNDKGECKAESLDGCKGGIYFWTCANQEYTPGECIIPVQPVRKYGKHDCPMIVMEKNGEHVTITDYNGVMTVRAIDGYFPDFAKCYPNDTAAQTIFVSVANLEAVLKAVKASAKRNDNLVKMELYGRLKPIRIATADCNMLVLPVNACTGEEW